MEKEEEEEEEKKKKKKKKKEKKMENNNPPQRNPQTSLHPHPLSEPTPIHTKTPKPPQRRPTQLTRDSKQTSKQTDTPAPERRPPQQRQRLDLALQRPARRGRLSSAPQT